MDRVRFFRRLELITVNKIHSIFQPRLGISNSRRTSTIRFFAMSTSLAATCSKHSRSKSGQAIPWHNIPVPAPAYSGRRRQILHSNAAILPQSIINCLILFAGSIACGGYGGHLYKHIIDKNHAPETQTKSLVISLWIAPAFFLFLSLFISFKLISLLHQISSPAHFARVLWQQRPSRRQHSGQGDLDQGHQGNQMNSIAAPASVYSVWERQILHSDTAIATINYPLFSLARRMHLVRCLWRLPLQAYY